MSPEVLSDEILVRQAREGDSKAFDALVLRYQEQAVMMAQGVLRHFDLAKDASQNGFAKAYLNLHRFRGESQFKTWLFRIILNEAKDIGRREKVKGMFRWQKPQEEEGEEQSLFDFVPSSDLSPRECIEKEELKKNLEKAVSKLPERERNVLMLRYFHELSLQEVAESLGVALGTVKAHLFHGTEKLKAALSKQTDFQVRTGKALEGDVS